MKRLSLLYTLLFCVSLTFLVHRAYSQARMSHSSKCAIHHTILQPDKVKIVYGWPGLFTMDLNDAEAILQARKGFPNANSFVYGGCIQDGREYAEVLYCSQCRVVEKEWEQHWCEEREFGAMMTAQISETIYKAQSTLSRIQTVLRDIRERDTLNDRSALVSPDKQLPLQLDLRFPSARMNIQDAEFTVTLTNRSKSTLTVVVTGVPERGMSLELLDRDGKPVRLSSDPVSMIPRGVYTDFANLAPGKSIAHRYKWLDHFDIIPKDPTRLSFFVTYDVAGLAADVWGNKIPKDAYLDPIASTKFTLEFSGGKISVVKPAEQTTDRGQKQP